MAVEDDVGDDADVARRAAERLVFFSDAVVAIAITLLALELPVPKGDTSREFLDSVGDYGFDYLTFLISFAVIGSHWSAHHRVFRWLESVNRPFVSCDLLWLLLIVLTPFLTEVLREGDINAAKFGVYALAQALLILLFGLMTSIAFRGGLFAPRTPTTVSRRGLLDALAHASGFALSFPLYLLIGQWAIALWVAVPLLEQRVMTQVLASRSRRARRV